MKKKILSLMLALSMIVTLLPVAVIPAAANTTIFEDVPGVEGDVRKHFWLPSTETTDDDYVTYLLSWNTDNACAGITLDSNIRKTNIQVYFTGQDISIVEQSGWNDCTITTNSYGVKNVNLYFTPSCLENTNGKAWVKIRAKCVPTTAQLNSSIGSTGTFGGSMVFTVGDQQFFKAKLGQNMYDPVNYFHDIDSYKIDKIFVDGETTHTLPSGTPVVASFRPSAVLKLGLDATSLEPALEMRGFAIHSATVIDMSGNSIPGVSAVIATNENGENTVGIEVTDDVYSYLGTAEKLDVKLTIDIAHTLVEFDSNGDSVVEYTATSSPITVTFNRPTVAVATSVKNATVNVDSVSYYKEAINGIIVPDDGYHYPESITVKVGRKELDASAYSYSPITGSFSLPESVVTGRVEITGSASGHTYVYVANNNEIIESCAKGCGHSSKATIYAPEDLQWDGSAKEALVVYEDNWAGSRNLVTEYTIPNTYGGDNTASITCGGAKACVSYTIAVEKGEHGCYVGGTDYDIWFSTTELPSEPGNYVLANDVTLSRSWAVPAGGVHLCLADHVINANGYNINMSGADLSIYDCASTVRYYEETDNAWKLSESVTELSTVGGVITGNVYFNINGGSNLTLYSGNIVGNYRQFEPAFDVNNASTLTINGGIIAGNSHVSWKSTIEVDSGSKAYINSCKFIENNSSSIVRASGEGSLAEISNSEMYANYSINGLVVADRGGKVYLKGVNMHDNKTSSQGMRVYGGELHLESGIFENNVNVHYDGILNDSSEGFTGKVFYYDDFVSRNNTSDDLACYYRVDTPRGDLVIAEKLTKPIVVSATLSDAGELEELPLRLTATEDTSLNDLSMFVCEEEGLYLGKLEDGQIYLSTVPFCTVTAEAEGNGAVEGTKTVMPGDSVTLTAAGNEEYRFVGWYDGDTLVCETEEFVVENVTEDKTYTAKFELIIKYTITAEATEGGTAEGTAIVEEGESVTLTAAAAEDYIFTGWYDGDTLVCETEEFVVENVTEDKTYTAKFVALYTITAEATEGGTVEGGETVQEGGSVTLIATAGDDYRFNGWYDGNSLVCETAKFVVENVTANKTYTAKFAPIVRYTITAKATEGGTAEGTGLVVEGESTTLTAVANEGYRFVGWYDGETLVCATPEFVVENVNAHKTYTAKFGLVDYKINSVTIKDMSGNELSTIPTGTFLATVSFTNMSSTADTVIVLAQYTDAGVFKGLMYVQTEDMPIGSTLKLSIPVDNSNGDITELKAFCWDSFDSLTPLSNSASFGAE